MGMFDKDKEIGTILQNMFPLGEPFIVWDVRIIREDFPTDMGLAVQTGLSVSKTTNPGDRYDVTTLASAIAAKAREAEASDFPAVVMLAKVPSRFGQDALVMQFLKPYGTTANTTTGDTPAPPAASDAPGF